MKEVLEVFIIRSGFIYEFEKPVSAFKFSNEKTERLDASFREATLLLSRACIRRGVALRKDASVFCFRLLAKFAQLFGRQQPVKCGALAKHEFVRGELAEAAFFELNAGIAAAGNENGDEVAQVWFMTDE